MEINKPLTFLTCVVINYTMDIIRESMLLWSLCASFVAMPANADFLMAVFCGYPYRHVIFVTQISSQLHVDDKRSVMPFSRGRKLDKLLLCLITDLPSCLLGDRLIFLVKITGHKKSGMYKRRVLLFHRGNPSITAHIHADFADRISGEYFVEFRFNLLDPLKTSFLSQCLLSLNISLLTKHL